MKNNALFSLFTLLLLPSFAFAIGSYVAGDKLTVHAASGLILRETAAPTGKKILTVEYGSLVTVQAEGLKKTPHSVTVFTGFTIKGFWVKVKTADGKTGFVFDGYLSKYKTPGSLPNGDDPNADDADAGTIQERYLQMHSPRKGAKVNLPKGETRYDRYKVAYTNGAEVEADMGEGGSAYTIKFNKEMTIEEAYLIGKAMWMEDAENIKSTISKGVISLLSGDELWAMEVSVKAGIVHLLMQHAD
ncbi:SH3 domain-containing protein [Haliscomenobacter sp.]|uniref:SH3 domain-containing protein n=1 Tax=Haliscomenobacter sp. TaxID=2717303 RepID=UPI0035941734